MTTTRDMVLFLRPPILSAVFPQAFSGASTAEWLLLHGLDTSHAVRARLSPPAGGATPTWRASYALALSALGACLISMLGLRSRWPIWRDSLPFVESDVTSLISERRLGNDAALLLAE